MAQGPILYKDCSSLKVGELTRYQITYLPPSKSQTSATPLELAPSPSLWVSIRNTESLPLRAAILRGPYLLYVDVRTEEFHHNKPTFVTAEQPKFAANLLPSQHFTAELSCHLIRERYVWIVDVVSQVLFSSGTDVAYEICIANTKKGLKGRCDEYGCFSDDLSVNVLDTVDLWNFPPTFPDKKYHLVVLTHGLHSNTYADMFYIKEQIDKIAKETDQNIIVRGYNGNVCKTEKGIRYLGSRLAEYIVNELYQDNIDKVSFVGHSLGGLIQTFAVAYIQLNFPWFFKKVEPMNFITMASPLLGIVNDSPTYVKAALFMGAVGRTGSELGLESSLSSGGEPLLKLLPTGPAHHILKRFRKRTLYANSVNDGIVPLYTSALFFIDWKAINQVSEIKKVKNDNEEEVGEIPINTPSSSTDTGLLRETAKTFIDPVQKAISLFAPTFQRTSSSSTPGEDSSLDSNKFPKTSVLESAASVLIPPTPSLKYLTDPSSRPPVIIHDKTYTEENLPPVKVKRKKSFLDTLDPMSKYQELEEEIARLWHKGLSWRKVLVKLEPDAHNNIIVRRRFINGFGWGVVDHLVENHFTMEEGTDHKCQITNNSDLEVADDSDIDTDLISLMNRESIQKENEQIDSGISSNPQFGTELTTAETNTSFDPADPQSKDDFKWINSKVHDTLFDVGPTGMLANLNEMFDTLRNWGISSNPIRGANGMNGYDSRNVQGGEVIDDFPVIDETGEDDFSKLQDTITQWNLY